MKLKYNSKNRPRKIKKAFLLFGKIKNFFSLDLVLNEGGAEYNFSPKSKVELFRYLTLFTKEEGTINWLKSTIKEGDVFVDIGANIGIYSVYAAKLANKVKVYSFEPHKPNFITLMDNIVRNGLHESISPISIALGNSCDVIKLNYHSLVSGSSNSQLGHKRTAGEEGEFTPQFEEIVTSITLDDLISKGAIVAPTVIKIDVDGNEILILEGMEALLTSNNKPRSIQVELNVGEQDRIIEWMKVRNYTMQSKHYTSAGLVSLQKGVKEDQIAYNAIFAPSA